MVKLITKEMHNLLFFKIKDFKSMGIKLNKDLQVNKNKNL